MGLSAVPYLLGYQKTGVGWSYGAEKVKKKKKKCKKLRIEMPIGRIAPQKELKLFQVHLVY